MTTVEIAGIGPGEVAHQQRADGQVVRCHEQMHMVRHKAIGMQRTSALRKQVAHDREVDQMVVAIAEADLLVVAALVNVQRDARHDEPCMPPHADKNVVGCQRLTADRIITDLSPIYSSSGAPPLATISCWRTLSTLKRSILPRMVLMRSSSAGASFMKRSGFERAMTNVLR